MKSESFEDIFIDKIKKVVESKSFTIKVIRHHFEKSGIILTPEQIRSIKDQLSISEKEEIEIEFSDEQVAIFADRGIDLNHLDLGQIDDTFNTELSKIREKAMTYVIEQLGSHFANKWSIAQPDIVAGRNRELDKFYAFLHNIWGTAFDALEAFISLCAELSEDQFSYGLTSLSKSKREVLARLQARSCQVSREICTLLRSGFADGAHARWRTLDELVTVGEFLLDAPDEVSEMYMAHANIARAKEAEEFQSHQQFFGYEPISDADMAEIIAAKEAARAKFGTDFLNDYGWATQHLKTHHNKKGGRTSFIDIELAVNKSRLRNYYKLANRNVHAGFWGEFSRLGSDPTWTGNILLAGPSHFGIAIPAHNTAYSLGLLTTGLLLEESSFETLISAKALNLLVIQFNDLVNRAAAQTKQD